MITQGTGRGADMPRGWFAQPEVDDEVLVAFLHDTRFESISVAMLETRLHQGPGLLGGSLALFLIRPMARRRISSGPKWGDVILKASEDAADSLSPVERLWLSGLAEPAPTAAAPRGPAAVKFGDIVLPVAALAASLVVHVAEGSGYDGEYVLTTVSHVGRSADGAARLLAGNGLVRRR